MADANLPKTLDDWCAHAEAVFVSRITPSAGLMPASTANNTHGDYSHAWVRDNVYSVTGLWALAKACERAGDGRATGLFAAVRTVMRGLLNVMIGQAAKVERFKATQDPLDGLHAKYDAHTGQPVVGDDGWGHLQIDATSLFVLQLAQFTAGGLRVVESEVEVAFVQNLVHYIAPAYRIADYGVWERGRKTNDGRVEVNASSVGMAKAALEAIALVDLLGPDAGAHGRVHVPPDAVSRARETLGALLPMESASKETDAALLSVVGWPAWAVDDPALADATRDRIEDRLFGRYGARRFLRDGHQTAVEEHGRLHYEPGELVRFDRIESEWPLFFTFAMLDATTTGDAGRADLFADRLEPLFQIRDGLPLLPELYWVPGDKVEAERARPGSQDRVPNENVPLFWAQAQWMAAELVRQGHARPEDIDPLGRGRQEAQVGAAEVRVLLVAADEAASDTLHRLGLRVAGIAEAREAAWLITAGDLVRAWTGIGACAALGLTGRAASRLGPLAAAQVCRCAGRPVLTSPTLLEAHDHHIRHDSAARARRVRGDIGHVARHWPRRWHRLTETDTPLFVLTLDRESLSGAGAGEMRALLADLAAGRVGDVTTRLVGVAEATAHVNGPDLALPADAGGASAPADVWCDIDDAEVLIERAHIDYVPEPELEGAYEAVARAGRWRPTRRASALLSRFDPRLADAAKDLVVRLRRLDIGGRIMVRPPSEREIVSALDAVVGVSSVEGVLAQEILLALGIAIKNDLGPFRGTRTVRLVEWLGRLAAEEVGGLAALAALPPSAVADRALRLLAATPGVRDTLGPDLSLLPGMEGRDWRAWRERLGVLTRVRSDFYARVWSLLHVCDGVQFGEPGDPASRVDAAIARSDWTAWERDFGLLIETRLERIRSPAYRAFCLEALNVACLLHEADPAWRVQGDLMLDPLIHAAVHALAGAAFDPWGHALSAPADVFAKAVRSVTQAGLRAGTAVSAR